MKDYFLLQFSMSNRKLKEGGINPFLGYILGLVVFVVVSAYLYQKTEFAKYLVILTCLSFLFRLSEKNRSDFLLSTFGDSKKRKIRIIENCLVSIPFLLVLIFKNNHLESITLLLASIFFATFSFQSNFNITIPTPFSKSPFEFTVGFRKTFYIFPIAYSLTIIAISVENFNLGLFSLLLIFLTSMSYYSKPENEYYVWIHSDTPKSFLFKKLKFASKNISLLVVPTLIGLLAFFPSNIGIILLFHLIGMLALWTIILAKYSAYPQEIHIPEGMLIAISILFPPLLLAVIPYFYNRSINNLKLLLDA